MGPRFPQQRLVLIFLTERFPDDLEKQMTEVEEPHEADEDAEENMGDELPDPWEDAEQTDWPKNEEEDI